MLLAILVAFGRLSADSELIALRSSGLSLYQLTPPVALFVLIAAAATASLSLYGRPWGNRSLKTALYDIARTRATAGIRSAVFNDDFPGLVIYTERIDTTTDELQRVLISDDRETQRNEIFAARGIMISDPDTQTVTLRLRDGFILTRSSEETEEYETHFESYDVSLDLRAALAGTKQREQDPKELTLTQLREAIAAKRAKGEPYTEELAEYHRNLAIPFACIVFGLVAVPLGIQPVRAARSRGFAVSLGIIFVYYMLLSGGQAVAQQGSIPPIVGLWLPNVIFGMTGIYLFRLAAQERPLVPVEWLKGVATALRDAVARRLGAEGTP
jgi:lipopolysaccharide export system permease protein